MEQLQLLLKDSQKKVSLEVIAAQPTFKDALKLCKSVSGLDDKALALEHDIDSAQWSRIFGNGGHFPENKLLRFMELCQNIVPLIWLSLKSGYQLQPLKSELELENERLRKEVEEMRIRQDAIQSFLKGIKV